jgi:uncharacterized RDD family membrane protein YckC
VDPAGAPPAAGFWRRLAAIGYDFMLLLAVWWLIALAYVMSGRALLGDAVLNDRGVVDGGLPLQLLLIGGTVLFFCYFWLRNGQTLGMQAWKLRIESTHAAPLHPRQCLLRCAGAVLSAICFGLGYLWILFDPERRAWHDRLSATRIVRID